MEDKRTFTFEQNQRLYWLYLSILSLPDDYRYEKGGWKDGAAERYYKTYGSNNFMLALDHSQYLLKPNGKSMGVDVDNVFDMWEMEFGTNHNETRGIVYSTRDTTKDRLLTSIRPIMASRLSPEDVKRFTCEDMAMLLIVV